MILYIAHRINTIEKLQSIPENVGIEIDIRSSSKQLILSHEPFYDSAERLDDFMKLVGKRFLIANIKSERIEPIFLESYKKIINKDNYFFLDSSFNVINTYSKNNNYSFAGRISEIESIETINHLNKKSLIKWIWIDAFGKQPFNKNLAEKLNNMKIKKCLTSPDLLGRNEEIEYFCKKILENGLILDAICCKFENIKIWKKYFKKYTI